MRLGIVIPAKDEQEYIVRTLESLASQACARSLDCEIVVVENGSSDRTREVVAEYARMSPANIALLSIDEPSAIEARILGVRHLLEREDPAHCLVSCDADTVYPHEWLQAVQDGFQAGWDVVACAGYMHPLLWDQCPNVTRRYIDEVGSIFFDPDTVNSLRLDERDLLFTHRIYAEFGRPLCSQGFAITSDAYVRIGGFRREYYDAGGTEEILLAATPLLFRAELADLRVGPSERPWWLTSPRRLVSEPYIQLGRQFQHTDMATIRTVDHTIYKRFDADADRFDYHDLRLNCVRDYILTPCVVRPDLVTSNSHRFGKLTSEVRRAILAVHQQRERLEPRHVFDTARRLTQRYGDALLEHLVEQRRPS